MKDVLERELAVVLRHAYARTVPVSQRMRAEKKRERKGGSRWQGTRADLEDVVVDEAHRLCEALCERQGLSEVLVRDVVHAARVDWVAAG